jgi:glycosyltransferase involved in cell wall biosynthesis
MNILFLDQFSELGGAQRCLLDLLPAINDNGWRATAALPGRGPLLDKLRAQKIEVLEIPCGPYQSGRKGGADMVRFARDVRAQVSLLRPRQPDLVYVNGPRLLAAAALAFAGRAPVLFHAHSSVPPGFQSRIAEWSIARAQATVVACCRSVAPSVPRARLRVIPNGTVDLEFRERSFTTQRIGIIGRISPEKGQDHFVRAAAILANQMPNGEFLVCGAPIFSDASYLDEVRKLAEGLPVKFLGWREDVAAVLHDLDLLVIPSKAEGLPRVMIEAFSAGVPVVAYPVGGIPEVIRDGDTGFLVRETTPEALAARIQEITAQSPGNLQKIAGNARRDWEQCFTVQNYRNSFTDLMARLVSDWRAEHGTKSPQ